MPITDSSTLSLRIAQTLRPLGIIRSMRSYSIIADCLRLIWEQEDRLEAVQKEVYEPIADKQCSDWTAIQSTIRIPRLGFIYFMRYGRTSVQKRSYK